ncbi:hypothetical protein [Marinobacterium stanieri]|uniref:hypothetical protein n=1 Tax=Marinobacterium stanieri TaxID=49186 RepID=UPI0009FA1BB0|nr:hypothetical protein [Marinobacterium stanieri]
MLGGEQGLGSHIDSLQSNHENIEQIKASAGEAVKAFAQDIPGSLSKGIGAADAAVDNVLNNVDSVANTESNVERLFASSKVGETAADTALALTGAGGLVRGGIKTASKNVGAVTDGRAAGRMQVGSVVPNRTPIPVDRLDPKVLKEIQPDSRGVYGYVPRPDSKYAKLDFTDVEKVESGRVIRLDYLEGSKELDNVIQVMRAEGRSSEDIARRVVIQRNSQKMESRSLMTQDGVVELEKRNLSSWFKDPVGPSPDQAFRHYQAQQIKNSNFMTDDQVWELVIKKSMQKDPVMNTLLGIESKY